MSLAIAGGSKKAAQLADRPARGGRRAALVLGVFAALVLFERLQPLRPTIEPGWRREARNLAIAATTALVLRLVEAPLNARLVERVERGGWGLLPTCKLPAPVETALALALLDYTLYLWHILLHRVPLLWRCHLVHHIDLDLTASTALRFHFAEMALSVPWRAAQIVLIGVRARTLALWQTATLIEILFHHANLRLPLVLERALQWIVMTPRLHGIHHSTVRHERDSNLSSGLTLWDVLHGTLRRGIPQQAITIGVPGFREPAQLSMPQLLEMPFLGQQE